MSAQPPIPGTMTLRGPSYEGSITWSATAPDAVTLIVHLRATRGRGSQVVRRVELVPRCPERVSVEDAWVGLSLVERAGELALYVTTPGHAGAASCELVARWSATATPRMAQGTAEATEGERRLGT